LCSVSLSVFLPIPSLSRSLSVVCVQQFGFDDQFGANDQIGAKNQFGRGALFGDKIMFGKNQEFGPRNTFASPEYLVGNDQYGHRNWGLQKTDLPANDVAAWDKMVAHYPDYIPEREARKRVLTLHQEGANKALTKAAAEVKKAATKQSTKARKAKAIAAIEKAAKTAEAETMRLKKVADSLEKIRA
jgi:hypothetical protein